VTVTQGIFQSGWTAKGLLQRQRCFAHENWSQNILLKNLGSSRNFWAFSSAGLTIFEAGLTFIHNNEIDPPLDGINCTFSLELEWRDVFGAQVQCTCFGQRRFASTI